MSANALPAQGVKLQIGLASPLVYHDIPEIVSFNGPGGAGQVIDVTDLASTAKEKRMGLHDEGSLSFEINFIPENTYHAALQAARRAQEVAKIQLVFTDDAETTWAFDAYVTNFAITGGVDGVIKASVTLEITGEIEEV